MRFATRPEDLSQAFLVHLDRRVSSDHVVSIEGVPYEVPRGYAGARLTLHRQVLEGWVGLVHEGRLLRLAPLDPHDNGQVWVNW